MPTAASEDSSWWHWFSAKMERKRCDFIRNKLLEHYHPDDNAATHRAGGLTEWFHKNDNDGIHLQLQDNKSGTTSKKVEFWISSVLTDIISLGVLRLHGQEQFKHLSLNRFLIIVTWRSIDLNIHAEGVHLRFLAADWKVPK